MADEPTLIQLGASARHCRWLSAGHRSIPARRSIGAAGEERRQAIDEAGRSRLPAGALWHQLSVVTGAGISGRGASPDPAPSVSDRRYWTLPP